MKVISNQRLVRLARTQPHTVNQLVAAGLTTYQAKKFGQGLLKALNTKRLPKLPPQPEQKHPPGEVIKRYKRLRLWRRDIAAGRSVPSDVILPNAVLWELAAHPPHSLDELQTFIGIGPWRCMTYGPDLIRILKNEG
jgi:ribonuclease D